MRHAVRHRNVRFSNWTAQVGNRSPWYSFYGNLTSLRSQMACLFRSPQALSHFTLKALSRSIYTRDQFKPLPQCVTQGQRQRVDVPEDDVKWERELLHVGFDFWQLSRAKYRHSDVKYGVFVGRVVKNHENHKYAGFSCSSNGFLHSLQGETQWRVNYSDFDFPIFHVTHCIAWKISNEHKFNERLNRPGSIHWTIL